MTDVMKADVRSNPYVGPRPFAQGERMYGRDVEVARLLEMLIPERIALLYSPSGAGKTSLVAAGLIPALELEGFHVLPVVRCGRLAPRHRDLNRYLWSTLVSLERSSRQPGDGSQTDEAAAEVEGLTLERYLDDHRRTSVTGGNSVLIFDQFEELVTLDPTDREAKAEFMAQLGDALCDLGLWALFSMREEFVAALDPYLDLLPTRLDTRFRLDLLTVGAAGDAIRSPAREAGVEFTEPAVSHLVDDLRRVRVQRPEGLSKVRGPYVEPVQLQVVCRQLWERRPPDTTSIDKEQVEHLGDVDGALGAYYDEWVAVAAHSTRLPEGAIRNWFEYGLVTTQGFRGQVLGGPSGSGSTEGEVLGVFQDAHLIRADETRGARWYELAHDRLIEPVKASNEEWKRQHRSGLQQRAEVWQSQGRPAALLARETALEEARRWAADNPEEIGQIERDFLEASQRSGSEQSQRSRRSALSAGLKVGLLAIPVLGTVLLDRRARGLVPSLAGAMLLSLFPAWLYLRFVRFRAQSVYGEYVLNLFRLGIDDYANLPAPYIGSPYYEPWALEQKLRGGSVGRNIYVAKFEAYYGKGRVGTLDVEYDRPTLRDRGRELAPLLPLTALLVVGWTIILRGDPAISGALRFGFLGAYVYVLQMLVRRFFQGEMRANTYIGAAVRIVTASTVVSILHVFLSGAVSPQNEALAAFMIGTFPPGGLQALQRLAAFVLRASVPTLQPNYPLSQLEGLSVWSEARLMESGIEDMQNLVTANLVDLILHARLPTGRLVDWIDQATLFLLLPPVVGPQSRDARATRATFRRLGIRTATNLEAVGSGLEDDPEFARALIPALFDVGEDEARASLASMLWGLSNAPNMVHVRAWIGAHPA